MCPLSCGCKTMARGEGVGEEVCVPSCGCKTMARRRVWERRCVSPPMWMLLPLMLHLEENNHYEIHMKVLIMSI